MNSILCPNCGSLSVKDDATAGKRICQLCGVVLGEMVLTEEIGFGETSSGAAVADGTRLSALATGVSFNQQNRYGGTSQELTESAGKRRCVDVASILNLGPGIGESAGRIWYIAYTKKFTRGRRGELVVAACVYLAIRVRKDPPPVMLIDFSDRLHNVNVFEVGAIYLKLVQVTGLKDFHPLDPAIYIHRFASLLEFGEDLENVKRDAANLVAGFRRDWMIEGRRPSGICGASLILAARMNNYRRSVAEVVQVVKIADSTIKKRLEEFQTTPAAQMSVAELRDRWGKHDRKEEAFPAASAPPIFQKHRRVEALQEAASARAARRATSEARSEAAEDSGDEERIMHGGTKRKRGKVPSKEQTGKGERSSSPPSEATFGARQRSPTAGPGPNTQANALARVGGSSIEDEEEDDDDILNSAVLDEALGQDVQEALADNDVANALEKIEHAKREEMQNIQQRIAHQPEDDPLKGLDEEELDDYILGPIEAKIKMHTWIDTNMDYLVSLQAKLRKNKLDELAGEAEAENKKPRMRRAPVGPADSAAASTKGFVERRLYSRNVNYAAIDGLFQTKTDEDDDSRAGTPMHELETKPTRAEDEDPDEDGEQEEQAAEDKEDGNEDEEEHRVHADHEQWD